MRRTIILIFMGFASCAELGGIDDPAHLRLDDPTVPHAETCETHGVCALLPPFGWSEPALMWVGRSDDGHAPDCPAAAPVIAWDGYSDLIAPAHGCTACECSEPMPQGTCALPSTLTAHAAICDDVAGSHATSFDAPPGWDGACTKANEIGIQAWCNGEFCVQSLTIAPLIAAQPPTPSCSQGEPSKVTGDYPAFGAQMRACRFNAYQYQCEDSGRSCVPPTPQGWARCVMRDGAIPTDSACPDAYPFRTVGYPEADSYDDARACTTCACGAPTTGHCESRLYAYYDWECSPANEAMMLAVGSDGAQCIDLLPGSPLRSKRATAPAWVAGSCEPHGGAPVGSVTPRDPVTFCCAD